MIKLQDITMSTIKNVKRHIPLRIRLFLKLVTNINS